MPDSLFCVLFYCIAILHLPLCHHRIRIVLHFVSQHALWSSCVCIWFFMCICKWVSMFLCVFLVLAATSYKFSCAIHFAISIRRTLIRHLSLYSYSLACLCLIIRMCMLLFRSSAFIGPFHLLHSSIALFPHFPYVFMWMCIWYDAFFIYIASFVFFSSLYLLSSSFVFDCWVSCVLLSLLWYYIALLCFRLYCLEKWNAWCPLSCRITVKWNVRKRVHRSMNKIDVRHARYVYMWNEYSCHLIRFILKSLLYNFISNTINIRPNEKYYKQSKYRDSKWQRKQFDMNRLVA